MTETRAAESQRIREKYPNQFPVIVLRARKSKLPPLDKHKFLLSGDMTLAQVCAEIVTYSESM
jgi:GABA(A) receptor-associated protein